MLASKRANPGEFARLVVSTPEDRPANARRGCGVTWLPFGALGLLPDPLRTGAARIVGSKRVYNLTGSNIPGPLGFLAP